MALVSPVYSPLYPLCIPRLFFCTSNNIRNTWKESLEWPPQQEHSPSDSRSCVKINSVQFWTSRSMDHVHFISDDLRRAGWGVLFFASCPLLARTTKALQIAKSCLIVQVLHSPDTYYLTMNCKSIIIELFSLSIVTIVVVPLLRFGNKVFLHKVKNARFSSLAILQPLLPKLEQSVVVEFSRAFFGKDCLSS